MAIDFRDIQDQILKMAQQAPQRAISRRELYAKAFELLHSDADRIQNIKARVSRVVQNHDQSLRCALPLNDSLTAANPQPPLPDEGTVIAADGSQISPDVHGQTFFGLINLGAVILRLADVQAPQITVASQLMVDEQLYTDTGLISEARFSLKRDLDERAWIAELARTASPPVFALTDGPLELWGSQAGEGWSGFEQSLRQYLETLSGLEVLEVIPCGYVDNPAANLVVRFLEMGLLSDDDLSQARKKHPLRGVFDRDLFKNVLKNGERSAVFTLQSRSSISYRGKLALHFFYMNVGLDEDGWIVRVEVPAWVAKDEDRLDKLHAVIGDQCRILGGHPYPYLLHRAHETALITHAERDQVSQMILNELHRHGVPISRQAPKPALKRL